MSRDYDVVIIGGGLSGGSLALALQSTGYKVAVVEAFTDEQRRSSPAGDRALALSHGTVCLLRSLGLWNGIATQSAPIRNIHISDQGHFGKARLSSSKEGVEALGYVITARVLEEHIASVLEASAVDRMCPARLMGFKPGPENVCLAMRQGERDLTLSTRLLVGADGVNSSVRRFLNIGQEVRDYKQTAFVTLVRPDIDPAGFAFERFTATGPLAVLPTLGGCCSVVWTQTAAEAERIATLNDEGFLARLQKSFGFRLGKLRLESAPVQFPLKLVRANKMIGQRSVLVGNAVHQLHPVAGQGFNLSVRDIAVLAERIVDDTGADRDPGAHGLLEAYATARREDHGTLIRATDAVVRVFSNDWLPVAGARGLALLGLDHCNFAKHQLARRAMGLGGRLPRIGAGLTQ